MPKEKFIHLVSSLSPHDAVSNYTLHLHNLLLKEGSSSHIFVNHLSPNLKSNSIHQLQEIEEFLKKNDNQDYRIIYQYSVHDPSTEYYLNLKGKKYFFYHNITPHKYFKIYNPAIAEICKQGRKALPELASHTSQAITMSNYSRNELIDHGFNPATTKTIPFVQPAKGKCRKHRSLKPNYNLLFVGKIAPHKKIEDLIKSFALYQKHFQPKAKLNLVGALGKGLYEEQLRGLIASLNCGQNITFHGRISDTALEKLYATSQVFITLSEHEGFCVPLIEAMRHQLPIIGFSSSAIAETLGHSGVHINDKDPGVIAATIHNLFEKPQLRKKIADAQLARLKFFNPSRINIQLKELLYKN